MRRFSLSTLTLSISVVLASACSDGKAEDGELEKGTYVSAPGDEMQALPALYLPIVETLRSWTASGIEEGRLTNQAGTL